MTRANSKGSPPGITTPQLQDISTGSDHQSASAGQLDREHDSAPKLNIAPEPSPQVTVEPENETALAEGEDAEEALVLTVVVCDGDFEHQAQPVTCEQSSSDRIRGRLITSQSNFRPAVLSITSFGRSVAPTDLKKG
jgi:hypothetical protein